MTTRPLDTSPEVWLAHNTVLDQMGGPARLHAAVELSDAVREIRLAGIHARNPGLSRQEAVAELVSEDYGVDLPGSP